jgi:MATE family multidrug resistance protein
VGAVILASVYWIFGFLRMGTTGLAAQAQGRGDLAERDAILWRGLVVAGLAGAVLVAGQGVLVRGAMALAPASAEVEGLARTYLAIRIWGAPATIAAYAITGWLIALERPRAVLALQLWINGVNAGLDLLFVPGLGWGVAGVAWATLVAEGTGAALGLWLCRGALAGAAGRAARARLGEAAALARMIAVNRDILLRTVLLQGAFTSFTFLAAGEGDVTLAATQILLQFLAITAYALDGLAFAAEALVGQAVGARAAPALRAAIRLPSLWGAAGAVALAAAFAAGGGAAIDLMATDPEVRAEARALLPWVVAAPLAGIASWMLDGIFIGATMTGAMLRCMAISVAAYALAVVALRPFGAEGLWAALMILNLVRGATMALAARGMVARLTA